MAWDLLLQKEQWPLQLKKLKKREQAQLPSGTPPILESLVITPLMAIKENMIGICVTNTRPSMAPTFGVQPMLGTNPIAFGAPTDEDIPFLFDAATTIIQRGKIEIQCPKGCKA